MSHASLPRFLLLALLAAALPATAFGKAYKCVVDGKTTYQDRPCAGAAPAATVAAPVAPTVAPRASRAPAQVYDEVRMVERHLKELSETATRDAELAKPRLATMEAKARAAELKQMEARWAPRLRTQREQLERLRAELRALCPGGVGDRGGHVECLH